MRVRAINDDYTMSMPLQVLKGLAADFDGDTLNIVYVPNYNFVENALEIFNPRNSMMISRNTGEVSTQTLPIKDTITNANNLINLGRKWYSNEDKNAIENILRKYEDAY